MWFWIVLAVLVVCWILFLLPGKPSEAGRRMVTGCNFAHRGLHSRDGAVPENSLPAFAAATDAGYGSELDVQLSRDGQVVVFHDDDLPRMTGAEGRVDSRTLAELQALRLGNTQETIPLFTEVLRVVAGRQPLIVELKSGPAWAELCEKTLAILRAYDGPYCVESFDPRIVAWFRRNAPDILRGQLLNPAREYSCCHLRAFFLSRGLCNLIARPHFMAWGGGAPNLSVRLCRALGAVGVFWTARPGFANKDKWDAVIFEYYTPSPRL